MKLEYKTGGRTKHFRGRYLTEPREDVLGTTSPGLARPSPEMPAHLTPLFQSQFRFFFCFVKAKKGGEKPREKRKREGEWDGQSSPCSVVGNLPRRGNKHIFQYIHVCVEQACNFPLPLTPVLSPPLAHLLVSLCCFFRSSKNIIGWTCAFLKKEVRGSQGRSVKSSLDYVKCVR